LRCPDAGRAEVVSPLASDHQGQFFDRHGP
jgi:hypothetical protein